MNMPSAPAHTPHVLDGIMHGIDCFDIRTIDTRFDELIEQ